MSVRGIFFDEQAVSASDHGLLFSRAVSDGVLSGAEITATYNTVFVNAGFVIMAGRIWEIQGNEAVSVSNAGGYNYARIKVQIDTSKASTAADNFKQVTFLAEYAADLEDFPELAKENINTGGGNLYEMEAAVLALNSNGIGSIVRRWA